MRFIAVYMPHGGNGDADVEGVYMHISALRRACVLLGDWNAVVGHFQPGDDENIVGAYGVGDRNDRGDWLVQWAMAQKLIIANTKCMKTFEEQWTHHHADSRRQLDYGLASLAKSQWIVDAGACDDIGVGRDHRTVSFH